MVPAVIKKYPSQISSAFKRFPVASALAIFTFFALVYDMEHVHFIDSAIGINALAWLGIYPIAAMLISLTTSLTQESLKSESRLPQAISGIAWFVLSIALAFGITTKIPSLTHYFVASCTLVYVTASLGIFVAPFWKDRDENAFWIFLFKSIKALVVGALVAALLFGSIAVLVFAFGTLFEYEFDDIIFLYIFYFCASVVFPILYFSGIPSIEECREEPPALNKFATSTIRFLFAPVLSLAILLFYAYIVKFILLWDMPQGMVSYFVSGFMLYMLALVTVLYPTRLAPGNTFEKKLLKVFPAACIPLVAMMSVGLIRRISDYGISAERIYALSINIFFYIIIAVFLIDKVKCKSRYIAVIFCAIFFVITDTPLSAYSISQRVWMGSIREALAEAGYTEFPLSMDDSREFIQELRKKDDANASLVVSRIKELASEADPNLGEYLSLATYDNAFYTPLTEDTCCTADKEPFDSFEASIEYPSMAMLQVPPGTKGAVTIDYDFDDDEFEFTGDTLTFRLSLKEDSGCSCNSDTTEACEETPVPVYSFTVDRQTLIQDSLKQVKTDGATFAISYLYAEESSKSSKTLRLRGILFTE